MSNTRQAIFLATLLAFISFTPASLHANGGPFVIKYPEGDTAAKGTVATIDPDLKPARESRLQVVKEDLRVTFLGNNITGREQDGGPPLVGVSAVYTIENPTDKDVEVEFGFPILRGIYLTPYSMVPSPEVQIRLDKENVPVEIISNSAIYGIIRRGTRELIDRSVASNTQLSKMVKAVKESGPAQRESARSALLNYLVREKKWDRRDAALMVEYASNRFQEPRDVIVVSGGNVFSHATWPNDRSPLQMTYANLGPLRAIGEQKATQFFAQLASCFDPKAASTYERIFSAWGGDVRELAVDLTSGKVRPREFTVAPDATAPVAYRDEYPADPTIYARVDYLDPKANITEDEMASCKAVLKNLDVVFTFAPMNILRYNAKFPAKSTKTLSVDYKQYAFTDTRSPESYQLAYVVHPASLWDNFGPINLEVITPEAINCKVSVPTTSLGVQQREIKVTPWEEKGKPASCSVYKTVLASREGELFVAVNAADWKTKFPAVAPGKPAPKPVVAPSPGVAPPADPASGGD